MRSRVAIAISAIIEKFELIFGGFWTFVTCVGILTEPADDLVVNIILIFFGVMAFAAFLDGLRRMKLRKDFKKIVKYLSMEPSGRLSGIATATGMSIEQLQKSIARMIYKGFFVDAYIDEVAGCLVVGRNKAVQQESFTGELIPRQCKNCGGVTKIVVGRPGQCDYCGTILN